jgi:glycosyltransferase involved in cell wall biosynthesis
MRIAFLWDSLSGYINACLKELASRPGVELFVGHLAASENAPFDESQFAWMRNRVILRSRRDVASLEEPLRKFQPDILIIASWNKPAYRAIAKAYAGKAWRVMGMDNYWLGTFKQRVGVWVAPFYVHPLADAVWLPGEPQAIFARKLGFEQRVILRGSYSCEQSRFADAYLSRINQNKQLSRVFLFIGRFAREKGLETLVRAYQSYRESSANPWSLVCCGTGPLQYLLESKAGIRIEGFVQPERLPEIMASAGCLVLPSEFEPWGLVVHEATSAGLPVLASEKVGAAVHLVQSSYNGFIFGCGDTEGLASLMSRVANLSVERLEDMARASYQLSQQYSPRRWADTLFESYNALWRKRHSGVVGISHETEM